MTNIEPALENSRIRNAINKYKGASPLKILFRPWILTFTPEPGMPVSCVTINPGTLLATPTEDYLQAASQYLLLSHSPHFPFETFVYLSHTLLPALHPTFDVLISNPTIILLSLLIFISRALYPIFEITNIFPCSTSILNLPYASVTTPFLFPSPPIHPSQGCPSGPRTIPVIGGGFKTEGKPPVTMDGLRLITIEFPSCV